MSGGPVLVLGIGNLLLQDEGVGVHALRELQAAPLPPGVDVLDGGTGGFHLLSCLQDYPCVVILDAAVEHGAVGQVRLHTPRFASDFPRVLSAHDIGLRDLIEAAALLGPLPRLVLITVDVDPDQPLGIGLSPPVQTAVSQVVALVQEVVRREFSSAAGVSGAHDCPTRCAGRA